MNDNNSIGLVKPKLVKIDKKLNLESGKILDNYQLKYETYGVLNANKSNCCLFK